MLCFLSTCSRSASSGLGGGEQEILRFNTEEVRSGEVISLEKLLARDLAVLLNFWSFRCSPCFVEIDALNRLYRGKLKGCRVEFIAVNTDGLEKKELIEAIQEQGIDIRFPVIADADMQLTNYYSDGFVPHTVIVTGSGGRDLEITGFNEKLFEKLEKRLFEIACKG
ncbi:MAG: redoxin domain-containing protein [Deltaproteobacteria bacterium]|nr:redoxin domain-containing protein [Deltaproteobacteria bacterium]